MATRMTAKDRVRCAMAHKEPDRAPVAYNGAGPGLAERIHDHYGVPDEPALWLKLGVDFWALSLGTDYVTRPDADAPGPTSHEHEHPLADVTSVQEVDRYFEAGRVELDHDRFFADHRDAHTDKFRFIGGGSLFEQAWHLRGFAALLEDLVLNPAIGEAILDHLLDGHRRRLEGVLARFNCQPGPHQIDMVSFSDDMGTQEDLIFSVAMFRQYFAPRWRVLTDLVHRAGAVTAIHSCGSVYSMIPELVDVGIDVLNPVQISARHMEPQRLKREFGRDLVFWGGIDTQTILQAYDPAGVRRKVREMIDTLGADGGYFCAPTHVVTEDTPAENVVAFFEEALS